MDMEWEEVDPIVKTVPWAKAWITVNKDAKPRLNLTLSEATLNDIGHPKKANIQVGTKDGKALVRLVFDPKGKFTLTDLAKGGARIHGIPAKEPIPDGSREPEACEVIRKDKQEAIFELPLGLWAKQLESEKPASIVPVHVPKAAAPATPPSNSRAGAQTGDGLIGALDAAAYLKKNGIPCHKLAGDWWMLRGDRVPKMDVLAAVNDIRRRKELPSLGIDNIE